MSYQPWKGKLEDGTEILVMLEVDPVGVPLIGSGFTAYSMSASAAGGVVSDVSVAFRDKPQHTWGPPTTLERAP